MHIRPPAWLIPVMFALGPTLAPASPGLPRLSLTTDDGADVTSKDVFAAGWLEVDPNGHADDWRARRRVQVRGRGNSTWLMPKRPYKVRLDEAHGLLGMAVNREWSLLANFADKSLLRNLLANHLGSRLVFDFTPKNQPVLLNLNGRDVGVYTLSEDINPSPGRLDLGANDPTGGYLLEIDQRRLNDYFETPRGIPYAIAEPRVPTPAQRTYIQDYVRAAEDALNSADFADPERGYAKFIDVPTFIDWYLVNEILKNSDAANYSSIYLHKRAGERLRMGPLWDFDLAAGNTDYTDALLPEGWWIRAQSPWFSRLFEDPRFVARVRARWTQLRDLGVDLAGIVEFIDRTAAELDEGQRLNFSIWPDLGRYVWPNAIVTGSYHGEVEYLKSWLITRMRWMDSHLRITSDEGIPTIDP